MIYRIFQIKDIAKTDYAFCSWVKAKCSFNFNDYKLVYISRIERSFRPNLTTIELLEQLFYVFNVNPPAHFKGHSLSMSDIVEIGDKRYYCDIMGWKEIEI